MCVYIFNLNYYFIQIVFDIRLVSENFKYSDTTNALREYGIDTDESIQCKVNRVNKLKADDTTLKPGMDDECKSEKSGLAGYMSSDDLLSLHSGENLIYEFCDDCKEAEYDLKNIEGTEIQHSYIYKTPENTTQCANKENSVLYSLPDSCIKSKMLIPDQAEDLYFHVVSVLK